MTPKNLKSPALFQSTVSFEKGDASYFKEGALFASLARCVWLGPSISHKQAVFYLLTHIRTLFEEIDALMCT